MVVFAMNSFARPQMKKTWVLAFARMSGILGLGMALSVAAQPPPPRVELPIETVHLSDGTDRYGVRIEVGGKSVLAGIDTGASGLRVMPDIAPGMKVEETPKEEIFAFGSGARPAGVIGKGKVAFGALSGDATLHLVKDVSCIASKPNCPGRLGKGYGFLGNGLVGEGFRVLLGGSMGPTTIDTPMLAVGAQRWIIELPRPGETAAGRLVLNPTDAEISGYRMASLVGGHAERDGGGLHDAVFGCLKHKVTGRTLCGLVTFDTGAYFARVLNVPQTAPLWKAGDALQLELMTPDRQPVAAIDWTTGAKGQQIAYGTAPARGTILQMGVAPYYALSVLYDPGRRRLGFKARE
jgi:hypothetical protein